MNAIVDQSPASGTVVPKVGTAVSVAVGVPAQINIPNVVGKPEAEAKAIMNGIPNVTFATVGGTPPGKAGTVQGQTASGNVPVGTAVTVNVYGPETPATTPPPAPPAATPPAGG